jgi:hypothetical protein
MADKSPPEMPTIVVVSRGPREMLREVLAGIEEEGVPYSVSDAPTGGVDALALAYFAARLSRLAVGVGIDVDGRACIQHDKRPAPDPVAVSAVRAGLPTARRFGHNAARVVVGIPLKSESVASR